MNIDNFLTSGIRFDKTEANLEFRIRFLNAVSLIAIIASIFFILLDLFNIRWMDSTTRQLTEVEGLTGLFIILHLRGRKHTYTFNAWILLIVSYLTFTSALLYIVDDELRPIWYLIWAVASYAILGKICGLGCTALSLLTLLYAKFYLGILISSYALYTFVLTLGVASGMAYAYTSLAYAYFEHIADTLAQMRELANKDALTGLWNLRFFSDASHKFFAMSQRNGDPICLLFIDIDRFKSINDDYGHQLGDHVLREVAIAMSSQLRKSDIISRIGGEEFVVLMPYTDTDGAYTLAEKLRASVAAIPEPIPCDKQRQVTISIGVAYDLRSDTSVIDMQKRADQAMYQAKQLGRNRVEIAGRTNSLSIQQGDFPSSLI